MVKLILTLLQIIFVASASLVNENPDVGKGTIVKYNFDIVTFNLFIHLTPFHTVTQDLYTLDRSHRMPRIMI